MAQVVLSAAGSAVGGPVGQIIGATLGRAVDGRMFPTSGFTPAEYTDLRREPQGRVVRELWQINEVRTGKALSEEGRRMGHCVSSYGWRIEKGDTSIWSASAATSSTVVCR